MTQIDLSGKGAIVTGGTRGIGLAISCALAGAGVKVIAIYRSDSAAAEAGLARIRGVNPRLDHACVQADISVEAEAQRALELAIDRLSAPPDILALNAAAGAHGPLTGMATAEWRRPFEVNVDAAFYLIRSSAPLMKPGGSIVFISSGAGHDPIEGLSAYGASKAAVNQIAAVLAQELGPNGIRVNVVSPGHTYKGDDNPNARPELLSDAQKEIVRTTALRRIGTAEDVAKCVLFFASDLSSFVTGQWLRVNGGRV
ncbi:MAG TPA: SDR family oxidoreductase [Chthonomonadales bacterium]|nr:SDR family oxidoreductase [Chthonomonadales bacterium]